MIIKINGLISKIPFFKKIYLRILNTVLLNSKDEFTKIFKDTIDNKIELTAFTLHKKDNSYKYHQYIFYEKYRKV